MQQGQPDKEIDLNQLWKVLKNGKKTILFITSPILFLALLYCLFATPIFTANAIINPPQLTDNGSGLASLLSGISSLDTTTKNNSDLNVAFLGSHSVIDPIIKKFNLMSYYRAKDIDGARKALLSATITKSDNKSGLITISVNDKSPQLASQIANQYVISLGNLISRIGFDQSSSKANFYNAQLKPAKQQLDEAQNNLKNFDIEHGITAGMQSEILIGLSTQLQAQLVVAQSQLKSMQLYATENNPDYKQLQAQVQSLQAQIFQLGGTEKTNDTEKYTIPANLAPEFAGEYTNLLTDIAFRQAVYRAFLQQYEISKIDTVSNQQPVIIQVVDWADVPLHKSKPKRLLIMVISLFSGLFLSSLYLVIKHRKLIIT